MAHDPRTNRTLALSLLAVVLGMVMLAYASVPLYRLFCQVTGFAGTPRIAGKAEARLPVKTIDRQVTVSFNAEVSPDLPWSFAPEQPQLTLKLGERRLALFQATNHASHAVTGRAIYNVTPHEVGGYFVKVQCFCFDQQTLQPGETAHFPVSFYVDPGLASDPDTRDITNITLSYTFYPLQS